ncbi:hypothetical protein FMM05_03030 [Flavobacterium zepuense]|uniref:Uncharacterized protein n=1 Tax=Flavobacterium zepuense TaxID=2593302 RepID=A0A552V7D9_9FLAO|nr:hypothetical protein [Flavobacterium zepuense]TRW26368.1 hypothetical protein FMM05_03030 [Flavobacterium zepuense]
MKKALVLLAILFSGFCFAQSETINNYKYVIIPEKFSFLKEPNKHNLNTLTKMVFEKYGFTVFYPNDQMPQDLMLNKCGALYGDLVDDSGILSTNITILLKDCSGKVVYTSLKGRSKEKDFKKAYYEALREAAASMAALNYQYNGTPILQAGHPNPNATASVPTTPATQQAVATATPAATVTPTIVNENQLFAQPIANGYQLVDTTPKVVARLYKTSQADYYSAQGEGKTGVIFKKGNDWFFEYYVNDKLVTEKLNIKF